MLRIAPAVTLPCPSDFDDDGKVNVSDLLKVLATWGAIAAPCPPSPRADSNSDCKVDVPDLLSLLGNWGSCP